jgi:hypothetical protein
MIGGENLINLIIIGIPSAVIGAFIYGVVSKLFTAARRPYPADKFDYWIRKLFKVRNLTGKSIAILENFVVNNDTIGEEEFVDLVKQFRKKIKDKIRAEGEFSKIGPVNFRLNFDNIRNLYHGSLEINAQTTEDDEDYIESFVISIKANNWKFADTDNLIQSMIELLKDGEAFFPGSGKILPTNSYDISLELNKEPVIYTYISRLNKGFATIKLDDLGMSVKISSKKISFGVNNFQGNVSEKIKETLIWYA